jgi:hypothetical protein
MMPLLEENIDHRRNPDGNQTYDVTRLWEHHGEICRLVAAGITSNVRIAALLGCTPQTVSNVRNSALAQAKIAELVAARDQDSIDVAKRIAELAPLAVDVMKMNMQAALNDDIDSLDVRKLGQVAAAGILDHAIPKKVQGTILHGHMSLSRIEEIKKRALIVETEIEDSPEITEDTTQGQ